MRFRVAATHNLTRGVNDVGVRSLWGAQFGKAGRTALGKALRANTTLTEFECVNGCRANPSGMMATHPCTCAQHRTPRTGSV